MVPSSPKKLRTSPRGVWPRVKPKTWVRPAESVVTRQGKRTTSSLMVGGIKSNTAKKPMRAAETMLRMILRSIGEDDSLRLAIEE